MTNLTQRQTSFIDLMRKSAEHARKGFEVLLKQDDFPIFFDGLQSEGLFDSKHNPPPTPASSTTVWIPYWSALDYLIECARRSGVEADAVLAQKVLGVVRNVSAFRESDGSIRDNYHTFRRFAEILGLVPTAAIALSDTDLVPVWLGSRFDTNGVAIALDEGALARLLASDAQQDLEKAVRLLRHCLSFTWGTKKGIGTNEPEPVTRVDAHWLEQLVRNHSRAFGTKIPSAAAAVFCDNIREIFGTGGRASWSWAFRAAVEEHAQNSFRSADGHNVEGLRDVLLAWCDARGLEAGPYVRQLIQSDVQMLRRIGIYVLSQRWSELQTVYAEVLGPSLFEITHLHELYTLLSLHFVAFDDAIKAATVEAIRNVTINNADASEDNLWHLQSRWLAAIAGANYAPVAEWIREKSGQAGLQRPEHPDFLSYISTSWGGRREPSPYEVQELVAFAKERTIAQKLSSVTSAESDHRSTSGLLDTLQQAVLAAPADFLNVLPTLVKVALPFQLSVIGGLRTHLRQAESRTLAYWNRFWEKLVGYFEQLVEQSTPDSDTDDGLGGMIWSITDMLRAGLEPEKALPDDLRTRVWDLIERLADIAHLVSEPSDEPMSQAINSPKGYVIEAAFAYTLAECRIQDREVQTHEAAWARVSSFFDRELERCENGNYEFSTLAGAYLANLDYADSEWIRKNVLRIFPFAQPVNFGCALGGLTYSTATRNTYVVLRDAGVLNVALEFDAQGHDTRERLIERIVLGYMWGDDTLDSPRFAYLFNASAADDLETATRFLRGLRREQLSDDQRARVVSFFRWALSWAEQRRPLPTRLMSHLSDLAWSLSDLSGDSITLLEAVAPFASKEHSAHDFVADLNRLAENDAAAIATVFAIFAAKYDSPYDYEEQIAQLVEKLGRLGQRDAALRLCDTLRRIPGITALHRRLTAASSG